MPDANAPSCRTEHTALALARKRSLRTLGCRRRTVLCRECKIRVTEPAWYRRALPAWRMQARIWWRMHLTKRGRMVAMIVVTLLALAAYAALVLLLNAYGPPQ